MEMVLPDGCEMCTSAHPSCFRVSSDLILYNLLRVPSVAICRRPSVFVANSRSDMEVKIPGKHPIRRILEPGESISP